MYQHMRLYEFSVSTKLVLTGFVLAVLAAVFLGLGGLYHVCRDADGDPAISFGDVRIFACGAEHSALEVAADRPDEYGLSGATPLHLELLRAWYENGAPRSDLGQMRRILKGSVFEEAAARGYQDLKPLAARPRGLSGAQLATGSALYLALTALVFLCLGMLFVRTSLFEKTKVLFVAATFAAAMACPLLLWIGTRNPAFLYAMLLCGLLLAVGGGVVALVALYDLWFRRPLT